MTSRVSPKKCSLRAAVGEHELCPGHECAFWEEGGAVIAGGCAIERLGVPVQRRPDLARHLVDLRLTLESVRSAAERTDAHRRFAELLNRNPD
jgi:hypothetical protein